jgi:RNA polymerase sigma factor (TIGR02999 family)
MSDVTRILSAIEHDDPKAAEDLLPLVYRELRRLAQQRLVQEKPGQTLQATALVHEAYVRLVDDKEGQRWNSRGHFFAAAAEAMRRILVDNARRKQTEKHGGRLERQDLDGIDEALAKLEASDPIQAQIVKLRFFVGLTEEDAASVLGLSRTTAQTYWRYAKAWLIVELRGTRRSEKLP